MLEINDITIREIKPEEEIILEDLLYASIYQSDLKVTIPRSVIYIPEVQVYIENFGQKPDDYILVADLKGQIIGGVWVRILAGEFKGYGNIDDKTPEFAVSVFQEYRKQGIGTLLMKQMISCLTTRGYSQASLSVQKQNYAVKMYKDLGFEIIDENEEDFIMILKFGKRESNAVLR
jgi:ribosomal protein S18 acetylase RimI-like enzyme